MINVLLYAEPGDEQAAAISGFLSELQDDHPHTLTEIDVTRDPALRSLYGSAGPVVEIGPYTLRPPMNKVDLKVALGAAGERRPPAQSGRRLNRGVLGFARRWLAIFNLIVFTYAFLPFAAPLLMKAGATGPARVLYTLYSPFCHQLAFRSFFLFGEQAAYPRELAGTGLESFGSVTGIDEGDFLAARAFVGDERVGYKVALCERDIAIYVGIFAAGVAYGVVRRRLMIPPLPLRYWALLGVAPIALDGFSQLLSQIPGFPIAARESTPFLRVLTGALFGVMNVWMAYPLINESMRETQEKLEAKFAVAEQRDAG